MASAAQIVANRSNAALCTGPTTAAGKQRSSENSLKHGLYSLRLILPSEDPAHFDDLLSDIEDSYKPANAAERLLARDIAESYWRLQRAKRIEANLLAAHAATDDDLAAYVSADRSGQYDRVARQIDRLQRAWHRAIEVLRRAQNERRRGEQHASLQRVNTAAEQASRAMAESYDDLRRYRRERAPREEIGFVSSPEPVAARPVRIPPLTGLEPAERRL